MTEEVKADIQPAKKKPASKKTAVKKPDLKYDWLAIGELVEAELESQNWTKEKHYAMPMLVFNVVRRIVVPALVNKLT